MTAPTPLARAASLHAAGVAANAQMRPLVALRHLRRALSLLDGTPGAEAALLRGRVLVTAALAESERGEVAAGLADLEDAEPLLPRHERGILHGQRGILLRRTGRDDLALEAYARALQLLDPVTEPEEVARVRLNRSVMLTVAAHPAAARTDLEACLGLARAHGFARLEAKAQHNLAVLDHRAGDLPAALRRFREVAAVYAVEAPGMLPVLALDRSRALLSAGLVTEADRALADAVRRLGGQRVGQDLAEAQLERAAAALLAGRPAVAREQARRAARVLARRDNPRWAARARLVALRADLARLGALPGAGGSGGKRPRRHGPWPRHPTSRPGRWCWPTSWRPWGSASPPGSRAPSARGPASAPRRGVPAHRVPIRHPMCGCCCHRAVLARATVSTRGWGGASRGPSSQRQQATRHPPDVTPHVASTTSTRRGCGWGRPTSGAGRRCTGATSRGSGSTSPCGTAARPRCSRGASEPARRRCSSHRCCRPTTREPRRGWPS